MKEIFKDELSKSSSILHDHIKMKIANWNYKMSDSLVAQADEILKVTSGDENGNLQIVSKRCAIEKNSHINIKPSSKTFYK